MMLMPFSSEVRIWVGLKINRSLWVTEEVQLPFDPFMFTSMHPVSFPVSHFLNGNKSPTSNFLKRYTFICLFGDLRSSSWFWWVFFLVLTLSAPWAKPRHHPLIFSFTTTSGKLPWTTFSDSKRLLTLEFFMFYVLFYDLCVLQPGGFCVPTTWSRSKDFSVATCGGSWLRWKLAAGHAAWSWWRSSTGFHGFGTTSTDSWRLTAPLMSPLVRKHAREEKSINSPTTCMWALLSLLAL